MQQVTAHIVAVAQGAAKTSEHLAAAQSDAAAQPGAPGFAQLLASQIGSKALAGTPALLLQDGPKALLDKLKAEIAKDPKATDEARDAVIQQVLDGAANLPLPQLIQQIHAERIGPCCDRDAKRPADEGLPLALQGLLKTQAKPEISVAAAASHVSAAANPDAEAAKFAGIERIVGEHDAPATDERAIAPVTLNVAVAQRAEPTQVTANTEVRVDVPVGEKGWDQAVAQKVVWLANNHQQTAQLHVNPPNLGPVEIHITISGEQASTQFISPHASVREALESALPRLREMFADSGLTLANVNVASEQQHQRPQQEHAHGRRRGGGAEAGLAGEVEGVGGVLRQGVAAIRTGADGLVDIFA